MEQIKFIDEHKNEVAGLTVYKNTHKALIFIPKGTKGAWQTMNFLVIAKFELKGWVQEAEVTFSDALPRSEIETWLENQKQGTSIIFTSLTETESKLIEWLKK